MQSKQVGGGGLEELAHRRAGRDGKLRAGIFAAGRLGRDRHANLHRRVRQWTDFQPVESHVHGQPRDAPARWNERRQRHRANYRRITRRARLSNFQSQISDAAPGSGLWNFESPILGLPGSQISNFKFPNPFLPSGRWGDRSPLPVPISLLLMACAIFAGLGPLAVRWVGIRLPISYFRLPTPDSPLPTRHSRAPSHKSRVLVLGSRIPNPKSLIPALLQLFALLGVGCGGGGNNNTVLNPGTPKGDYLLTITATTTSGSTTTSHAITLTLKVT